MDPIAESEIYHKYNQISEGKTTVFISHRLASTNFCNRIITDKMTEEAFDKAAANVDMISRIRIDDTKLQ